MAKTLLVKVYIIQVHSMYNTSFKEPCSDRSGFYACINCCTLAYQANNTQALCFYDCNKRQPKFVLI